MSGNTSLDPKVASVLNNHAEEEDPDSDDLLAELEQEDDSAYRAARLQQLSTEINSRKANGNGLAPSHATDNSYITIRSDSEFLELTTQAPTAMVHLFHADFTRCRVMDLAMQELARRHGDSVGIGATRFARLDVSEAEFVVKKLKVRVLPCVLGFKEGIVVERVTGFEGLGSGMGREESIGGGLDGFDLGLLEERMVKKEVLSGVKIGRAERRGGRGGGSDDEDSEGEGVGVGRRGTRGIRDGFKKQRSAGNEDDDSDWD